MVIMASGFAHGHKHNNDDNIVAEDGSHTPANLQLALVSRALL